MTNPRTARALFPAILLLLATPVSAQFDFAQNEPDGSRYVGGPRLGESKTQIWRTGIIIEPGAAMENLQVSIPVPANWREQRIISINEESMDANLASRIEYRPHSAGAMEMFLQFGSIRPTRPVEIVIAFELQNYELLPPDNPGRYSIPSTRQLPPDMRQFTLPSPYIESDEAIFKRMFAEITKDRKSDWDKVEALYSFVQNNVRYNDQAWRYDVKGALALVKQPKGQWTADCKDMTCLFVALCRAGNIPARVVRVPGHCYAEFYLELRPENQNSRARNTMNMGFWFPCQVAGTYSFGGIPERRVILQKGDSFPNTDSPNPRARTIWLREVFAGALSPGSPPPRFEWVRESIAKN
ncbi:MAG: transglutaminase family protein [Planctomycetaceae bacterium]|nr:transglutaminase family protein [Planctomycetaceae bacterium]